MTVNSESIHTRAVWTVVTEVTVVEVVSAEIYFCRPEQLYTYPCLSVSVGINICENDTFTRVKSNQFIFNSESMDNSKTGYNKNSSDSSDIGDNSNNIKRANICHSSKRSVFRASFSQNIT